MRRFWSTAIVISLCSGFSCLGDADRANPLDPKSDNFEDSGAVLGETLTYFTPFQTVPNVDIKLEPGGLSTSSDTDGRFSFPKIPSGSYVLSATKNGFAPDTASIMVRQAESMQVQLNLNALPSIDSLAVFSCHIRRIFPEDDLLFLQVMARTSDPDGINDIRFVGFDIPQLGFSDTLEITATVGTFIKLIPESDLPVTNLEDLIGRRVFLRASDLAESVTSSEAVFLARVIRDTPRADAPDQFELLNEQNPLLTWRPIGPTELPFDFTFRVEVVRFQLGLETVIWTLPDIPKEVTSIQVEPSLTSGSYFWTVSVVDEFGNWSRSLEASFRININ